MAEAAHDKRVNSNILVDAFFDSLMIRYSYIDNVEPCMDYELFGKVYKTPVLGAALGLHTRFHESGSLGYARGIASGGSVNFNGWIEDEELEAICAESIASARGVKPFADHDRIYQCIEHDEKCGAIAVCMDLDHIFDVDGRHVDAPYGKCGRQTVHDLRGYASSTKLPFILKGILTAKDAEKAVEAGAAAIIVSNHNNRFPSMIPPLVALPEIKKAVAGQIPVLVDGGIESGVEAFKAFACGADGVMVCRTLMKEFSKGGPGAVAEKLIRMTDELRGIMANTGASCVSEIQADMIAKRDF